MQEKDIKKMVRVEYAKIAKQNSSCCAPVSSCCSSPSVAANLSKKIGYTEKDLNAVPDGANLGLGCGNPVALASLKKGEIVLDLGSGAGFDCFLAAKKVGKSGRVIGVDMTPEMIDKARENARKGNYKNVEFRLGVIENIPAADNSVDVVISNCVINLAPNKKSVFKEAFRVLKPGGRLMVSDLVILKKLPAVVKNSMEAYIGCLSGAILKNEYIKAINQAGFEDVIIIDEIAYPIELVANDTTAQAIIENLKIPKNELNKIINSVVSIKVQGKKPKK
ncbi:MAG: arsenite methyltransferase [bacterium]|nr:arsenite methyltransferase [bacterium]